MKQRSATMNNQWGYLFAAAAALLWASSGTAAKFLFNSGMSPFQLVQLRITVSVVLLFGWMAFFRPKLLIISRSDIFYFAVLGIFGIAAVQFFYLFAISKINVAAAILLEYLAPVLIALYTAIFLREKLSGYVITAIGGAVAGCYLVVGAYNLDILALKGIGILSGLGSAAAFAWYTVHGEHGMRRYDPWTVLFYSSFFALIAWNILYPPLKAFIQPYSLQNWLWIAYISILGTAVPFGLYYEGVNLIRSTRASITATLEPISAGLISYLFLHEVMSLVQIIGGILVIGSVILLQLTHEADDKAPGMLRRTGNGEA
ncbi:MAG: EamA family transporter [Deltaproteobacteria bacterium]|jgi:drug/metabolite transporter (DMT)-like permease